MTTKEKDKPDLSPKTYVCMGILLCIIGALALTATSLYWNAGRNPEPTLQAPEHKIAPSPNYLTSILATALQEEPIKSNIYRLEIPAEEHERFRMHFKNAGARRGWYTHSPNPIGMRIVLPEQELGQLDEIQADPMGWIEREASRTGPAVGPSSLDLTNATVRIYKTDLRVKQNLFLAGGIAMCLIISVLGVTMVAVGCEDYIRERKKAARTTQAGNGDARWQPPA